MPKSKDSNSIDAAIAEASSSLEALATPEAMERRRRLLGEHARFADARARLVEATHDRDAAPGELEANRAARKLVVAECVREAARAGITLDATADVRTFQKSVGEALRARSERGDALGSSLTQIDFLIEASEQELVEGDRFVQIAQEHFDIVFSDLIHELEAATELTHALQRSSRRSRKGH
jgi:predicted metal-dependent hydrolase